MAEAPPREHRLSPNGTSLGSSVPTSVSSCGEPPSPLLPSARQLAPPRLIALGPPLVHRSKPRPACAPRRPRPLPRALKPSAGALAWAGGSGCTPSWAGYDEAELERLLAGSEWLPSAAYLRWASMARWYLRAFYWATCNLTGLGRDMAPLREGPLLFTLLCFLLGVFALAYLTSTIVTLVMESDAARFAFTHKKLALLGFMERAHIDEGIVGRSEAWLEHSWHAQGGMPMADTLAQLPRPLAEALRTELFIAATRHSAVFAPVWRALPDYVAAADGGSSSLSNDGSIKALVHAMVCAMGIEVYNRGESVLTRGMLNPSIFVVSLGSARVILGHDDARPLRGSSIRIGRRASTTLIGGQFVAELRVGDIFGEVSAH